MAGGLLFVRYINDIEALLSAVTHRKVFDDTIYYFDSIPTLVNAWTVGVDRPGRPVHRRGGERLAGAAGGEAAPGAGLAVRDTNNGRSRPERTPT